MISANHVGSIEELVTALPDSYRSQFVLMYGSRAFAKASLEFPKLILHGNTGRFLLTFGGDPSDPGFQTLEVIEYQDCARSFELHAIQFDTGRAVVSEANPAKCLACHGHDPHPLWDTYPVWRGAFGSFAGVSGQPFAAPGSPEAKGLAAFLAHRSKQGRYAAFNYSSYLPPNDVSSSHMPPDRFNFMVNKWVMHRAARKILDAPGLAANKSAIAGLALVCGGRFVPGSLGGPIESLNQSYLQLRSTVRERIKDDYRIRAAAVADVSGYQSAYGENGFDLYDLDCAAAWEDLLPRLGLKLADLTSVFGNGDYTFQHEGITALGNTVLAEMALLHDSDLPIVATIYPSPDMADSVIGGSWSEFEDRWLRALRSSL